MTWLGVVDEMKHVVTQKLFWAFIVVLILILNLKNHSSSSNN